jgi:hypothetical protein
MRRVFRYLNVIDELTRMHVEIIFETKRKVKPIQKGGYFIYFIGLATN